MSSALAVGFFTTSALVKVVAPAQRSKLCGIMTIVTPEVVFPPFCYLILQGSDSGTASL